MGSIRAADQARVIGAILLEWGLVLEEELADALQLQEATGGRLGEILVAYHGVSRLALASALAEQWSAVERPDPVEGTPVRSASDAPLSAEALRRPIGEVLVELGIICPAQLEEALDMQQTTGDPLGEILVRQGNLSRLDLAGALAAHWSSDNGEARGIVPERSPTPTADDLAHRLEQLEGRVRELEALFTAAARTD